MPEQARCFDTKSFAFSISSKSMLVFSNTHTASTLMGQPVTLPQNFKAFHGIILSVIRIVDSFHRTEHLIESMEIFSLLMSVKLRL
jgi:hypothetical protein